MDLIPCLFQELEKIPLMNLIPFDWRIRASIGDHEN
jgi:hypothetical protein